MVLYDLLANQRRYGTPGHPRPLFELQPEPRQLIVSIGQRAGFSAETGSLN